MYADTQTHKRSATGPSHPTRLFSFTPALLFLALIWPFGGKDVEMVAGTDNPAARCTVHVDKGGNGNTEMNLKAQSMASPSSLSPAKSVYVVWVQPPGEDAQNLGQLKVSKDQRGEIKTATPYKRFKVFITAEDKAQIKEPEGPTILSGEVTED
jgi:hypothetical protein